MITLRVCGAQRGQLLVETAVAMLAFAMFLFGVMQFGFLLYSYDTICNAAREGARYAMVHGSKSSSPATTTTIQNIVQGQAIGLGTLTVTTTWTPDNKPGRVVKGHMSYTAPLSVRLLETT